MQVPALCQMKGVDKDEALAWALTTPLTEARRGLGPDIVLEEHAYRKEAGVLTSFQELIV